MVDNQQENEVSKPRYWRLFELVAATIYVASIVAFIVILRNPEWHTHLLRLMGRAWNDFVAQDVGSTTRGFLNGGLEVVLGAAAVAVMTGYFLGRNEPRKDRVETAIITLVSFATVALVIYGTQFAWEVAKVGYRDHHELADSNKLLITKNASLVEEKKQLISPIEAQNEIAGLHKKINELNTSLSGPIETVEYLLDGNQGVKLADGHSGHTYMVVGLTRTKISPVDTTLKCSSDMFVLFTGPQIGGADSLLFPLAKTLDPRSAKITVQAPAWTVIHPLMVQVFSQSNSLKCNFAISP
jgi:hypothetical protein